MADRFAFVRLLPMAAVMATIFYLSHKPADELDFVSFYMADKLGHLIMYGTLAATTLFAWQASSRHRYPLRTVGTVLLVSTLYGVLDEYHQSFIVGRVASAADLAADIAGAGIVALIWYWRRSDTQMTGDATR